MKPIDVAEVDKSCAAALCVGLLAGFASHLPPAAMEAALKAVAEYDAAAAALRELREALAALPSEFGECEVVVALTDLALDFDATPVSVDVEPGYSRHEVVMRLRN